MSTWPCLLPVADPLSATSAIFARIVLKLLFTNRLPRLVLPGVTIGTGYPLFNALLPQCLQNGGKHRAPTANSTVYRNYAFTLVFQEVSLLHTL